LRVSQKGTLFFGKNTWVDNLRKIVKKEGGCLPLQAYQV